MGSPAAGRCAGVTGLLFLAPHSGPENVRGAGALSGIVCTRATSHPEYPVLFRITPQPDSSTPSPSHAQRRFSTRPKHPSQGPPTRSPSPAIRPPLPGPRYPQLDLPPSCSPSPLYNQTPHPKLGSIPSRGPACPLRVEGPSLLHIPVRCRHQCSTRSRPPGPPPMLLPSPGSGL